MSEAEQPAARSAFSPLTLLIIIIVAGTVFALVWSRINSPAMTGVTLDYERTMQNMGLGAPTTNRLADVFVDADQNLIADTPSDPAALRDPETLRFCFLNDQGGAADPGRWQPLLEAITQKTGRPAEYVSFATVEAQLSALRSGALDVTVFNTGNVPRAVNAAGFVPVVGPAIQGKPATYKMLIITAADSDIKNIEGLRGRSVTLTRIGSNSGYKAPLVILLKNFGLAPERDFDWAFSGSHEASIRGVADGTFVVAAVASDLYHAAIERGELDEKKVRVVYESEPFPRVALGYAHDLEPALAQGVTEALLSFSLTGTPLQPSFADGDGFTALSYKDSFGLVRMIDDAVGFKHQIGPKPTP